MPTGLRVGVITTGFVRRAVFVLAVALVCPLPSARADFDTALAAVDSGDYALALMEFRALAQRGDPRGENGLGILHLRGNAVPRDLKAAFNFFHSAATKGLAVAQNNLAETYDNGWGVRADPLQARHWYAVAAEQGNVDARAALGIMLLDGRGVPQATEQGRAWLEQAAYAGHPEAQAHLGHLYRAGDAGLARDYVKAYAWYGVAAAGGYDMGPEFRDSVALYLSPADLRAAQQLARALHQKHGPDS